MSTSREEILARVRQNRPAAVPLPSLDRKWVAYADPIAQFIETVKLIGGSALVVADRAAADHELARLQSGSLQGPCVSLVPSVGVSTIELEAIEDPHQLASLEWGVLPGEVAVAENGAVWVTDRSCRHRAVYFLCEHLVLVVAKESAVENMHQAYSKLEGFGTADDPPFGTWLAGPSKTADIEQSLVIGAQGPRSLVVLLLEDPTLPS